jgi:hypothetical protein
MNGLMWGMGRFMMSNHSRQRALGEWEGRGFLEAVQPKWQRVKDMWAVAVGLSSKVLCILWSVEVGLIDFLR